MADISTTDALATAAQSAANAASSVAGTIFAQTSVSMATFMFCIVIGFVLIFYRIQKSKRLDFADMLTKNGKTVSLTKVLQLIGGITATWVIVKMTLTGSLTESIFGLYLTYVGAIEGYSKFVAAKYGYNEKSIKDAQPKDEQ
jgi:hypothetical protein